jgi:hypothetical protein
LNNRDRTETRPGQYQVQALLVALVSSLTIGINLVVEVLAQISKN